MLDVVRNCSMLCVELSAIDCFMQPLDQLESCRLRMFSCNQSAMNSAARRGRNSILLYNFFDVSLFFPFFSAHYGGFRPGIL